MEHYTYDRIAELDRRITAIEDVLRQMIKPEEEKTEPEKKPKKKPTEENKIVEE